MCLEAIFKTHTVLSLAFYVMKLEGERVMCSFESEREAASKPNERNDRVREYVTHQQKHGVTKRRVEKYKDVKQEEEEK